MTDRVFLDTNILFYAALANPEDRQKTESALDTVLNELFCSSTQSLSEFVSAALRAKVKLAAETIERWLTYLEVMPSVQVDAEMVRRALVLTKTCKISFYDAQLVAAAEHLGCHTFFSEDLNSGQAYGDVIVIDPFIQTNWNTN